MNVNCVWVLLKHFSWKVLSLLIVAKIRQRNFSNLSRHPLDNQWDLNSIMRKFSLISVLYPWQIFKVCVTLLTQWEYFSIRIRWQQTTKYTVKACLWKAVATSVSKIRSAKYSHIYKRQLIVVGATLRNMFFEKKIKMSWN